MSDLENKTNQMAAETPRRPRTSFLLSAIRALPDKALKFVVLIVEGVTVNLQPEEAREFARQLRNVANEVDPISCRNGEMQCEIDTKYAVIDKQIVNRRGEPIPSDEPIILLRARDKIAQEAFAHYYELSAKNPEVPQFQVRQVSDMLAQWNMFAARNPNRMKFPD